MPNSSSWVSFLQVFSLNPCTPFSSTLSHQSTERAPPTLNSARSTPLTVGGVHSKARSTHSALRDKSATVSQHSLNVCLFFLQLCRVPSPVGNDQKVSVLFQVSLYLRTGLSAEWTLCSLLRAASL
jgi:hypothetical protein